MNSNPFPNELQTLRETLAEIDPEPGPLTTDLVLLRDLLSNRLCRLEAESQRVAAPKLDANEEER